MKEKKFALKYKTGVWTFRTFDKHISIADDCEPIHVAALFRCMANALDPDFQKQQEAMVRRGIELSKLI